MLSISDNGSGISSEIKDKIFEPFFTTKPRGKGTGLGLSKVFGFVKRAGGELNIYTEINMGTEFKLFFPKSINSSVSVNHSSPFKRENLKGVGTVLIVDDEHELAIIAESYLSDAGYKTYIANCGEEALSILENHSDEIDLVLSDVVMSGKVNGYVLANIVMRKWPNIRLSLMSGFTADIERGISQKKHISRHLSRSLLPKPYSERALLTHVKKAINEEIHIKWDERFSTGINTIDDDHKKLIFLLNIIYADDLIDASSEDFLRVLEDLNNYSQYHFKREETAMEACDFPYFKEHSIAHVKLISQLEIFIKQVKCKATTMEKKETLKAVQHWLFNHLEEMDCEIYQYAEGKEAEIKLALSKLNDTFEL